MERPDLIDMFPDADYGFSMRMRTCAPEDFFAPTSERGEILRERRRWLEGDPGRYAGLEPAGVDWPQELWALAAHWGMIESTAESGPLNPEERLIALGTRWEPDFLVLTPDLNGVFLLRAGCVCFPSSWALDEKMGKPLGQIHGVVPGLNQTIGPRINTFLTRMKPGPGWLRANWGISSSDERNQHPSRALNRLSADTDPAKTWVRVEHQLLMRLEASGAVLFGIRLENLAMTRIQRHERLRLGLRRALTTMPGAMLEYKNLSAIQPSLVHYLT